MDKLFGWVWRINGLLILVCALLLVGNLGFDFLERHTRESRDPEPTVTNIVADPDGKEQWVLGTPHKIAGSDFAYVRLESENERVDQSDGNLNMFGSDGDYVTRNAKNILFINRKTETANWLFDDVNQLVVSVRELPERSYASYPYNSKSRINTIAIVYSVITKDTNGDGTVNDSDSPILAVSDIDGTNYHVILENSERIMSIELLDEDILSILYQLDGRAYSNNFSLKSYENLSEFELPEVGH